MWTKLQLPTGKNCAQIVQAVGKRKWAVKYTVHSMQALRPLSTMTHCSSDSTWLRSPCPGRMPWSSGGSTPLFCSAMLPFLLPGHIPALQQHCSHSDKWPRLWGSWWQEPWHKSGAPCTGLWQAALQDAAPQTCLPTPLPQLLSQGTAALVPQSHIPKTLHCAVSAGAA